MIEKFSCKTQQMPFVLQDSHRHEKTKLSSRSIREEIGLFIKIGLLLSSLNFKDFFNGVCCILQLNFSIEEA